MGERGAKEEREREGGREGEKAMEREWRERGNHSNDNNTGKGGGGRMETEYS